MRECECQDACCEHCGGTMHMVDIDDLRQYCRVDLSGNPCVALCDGCGADAMETGHFYIVEEQDV